MCGIVGIYAKTDKGKESLVHLDSAINKLGRRGPDSNGKFVHNKVGLGHARLSIIDLSDAASQPFTDNTGRYTIVYNGEVYNFKQLAELLSEKGIVFRSKSDTEVILYLYIFYGKNFVKMLNGFFAIAIYDNFEQNLFIVRDRMGIKPLLLYEDNDKIVFASEMKAILAFNITKELDYSSLSIYLQLNYIPSPYSILRNVRKIEPGAYATIEKGDLSIHKYFEIPYKKDFFDIDTLSYDESKKVLHELLTKSIEKRLISDVPIGAFLSGGIDSSVIVSIASKLTKHLNTFSIGYADEPFFDETNYATLVAEKYKTNHTVFKLKNNDLFAELYNVLDYIDEPFADSSALAVYILSKQTKKHATVALSGDGADELFSGYNKHAAEFRIRQAGIINNIIKNSAPLWAIMPKSRNTALGNRIRQLYKYSQGLKLDAKQRYWLWAGINQERNAEKLLLNRRFTLEYQNIKSEILKNISKNNGINDILYTDLHLVLVGDMLQKVDYMSMANSLEVRVPFLDHEIVEFVMQLPSEYKIQKNMRKMILQDTFRELLPPELYNRPKHGFEVPLLKWLRSDLQTLINQDLLSKEWIEEQKIFDYTEIEKIKRKLFSNNPEDAQAQIWGLIVFQYWYKKYMM